MIDAIRAAIAEWPRHADELEIGVSRDEIGERLTHIDERLSCAPDEMAYGHGRVPLFIQCAGKSLRFNAYPKLRRIVRFGMCPLKMDDFHDGFEENHELRSCFVRRLTLDQLDSDHSEENLQADNASAIPRTLIRYWHDVSAVPDDVRTCLDSWERLRGEGFEILTFDDTSAAAYVSTRFGVRERSAFERCRHPAMRSDYLRLCYVLADGGFYVDADDVLTGGSWWKLYADDRLKLQPLCYDIPSGSMVSSSELWRADLSTEGRIFYVNNNPLIAPADHPVLRRALDRATRLLLGDDPFPEIQSTTGPGNLSAALVAHARVLETLGAPLDFELRRDWDSIAETRWELSYRADDRNWRNMDGR